MSSQQYLRQQELKQRISNENTLNIRMIEHRNGFESEPLDTQNQLDNRSNYDQRLDTQAMERDYRQKVYTLFSNDPTDSHSFLTNFHDIPHFRVIFPDLMRKFFGTLPNPLVVVNYANSLIKTMLSSKPRAQPVKPRAPEKSKQHLPPMPEQISSSDFESSNNNNNMFSPLAQSKKETRKQKKVSTEAKSLQKQTAKETAKETKAEEARLKKSFKAVKADAKKHKESEEKMVDAINNPKQSTPIAKNTRANKKQKQLKGQTNLYGEYVLNL
jgi:hypothetical protein